MFGIKRRFQRCKVWPLGSRSPPYEHIKFRYPLENVRFLLLSINLARQWLQLSADRLAAYHNNHCWRAFRGYQHRWPWTTVNPKIRGFKWFFCYFRLRRTLKSEFSLKYTGDRPRQPAYEIKLMLWRVSWALAQIFCLQPMLVSNSNTRLKISTFGLRDIIGHVAVRPAIYDRPMIGGQL